MAERKRTGKAVAYATVRNRAQVLLARRHLKMAASAHAYVRGSTAQFYQWLHNQNARVVPQGPPVWICGDCHLGNLGPLADSKGVIHVQIRDLDQTVVGNPNHDLIRLALSLASAARGSDLPGVTTAHMLEHMMHGYEAALRDRDVSSVTATKPECVRLVMRRAEKRTWKHLARERLENLKPSIPRGEKYWPLSREEQRAVTKLLARDEVRTLVASLKSRDNDAQIAILDAAYWMKGCSSLGKLRIAVLLEVLGPDKETEFCMVDIKEATPASAPRARHAEMPTDHGARVVQGAKRLSPALGERMMAAKLLGKSVILRELMPQDLKLEVDRLTTVEAIGAARYLAGIVGKAHARQMDDATRREFYRALRAHRSKRLSAPSWLWRSVVELIATHEAAYLEHCRLYALGPPHRADRGAVPKSRTTS